MKRIASKIISFICVICMVSALCPLAQAADTNPKIEVKLSKNGQTASITLSDVGVAVYSAQITLKIRPENLTYTLTPSNSNAYGAVRSENGNTVLYIDSTELLDGSKSIKLASLKANKEMTSIGGSAELILVDRSMRSLNFGDVDVDVSKESSNGGGGGGGGSTGGKGGSIAGGAAESETPSVTPTEQISGFIDIDSHWAKDSIEYVTGKGLFKGTSDDTFEPSTNMTRAMYVVVLNRFGSRIDPKWSIECNSPMFFDDVPDGTWYSDAVAWAGGIGLVNGVGDGIFEPDTPVTREQIAVMTVNFAKLCGQELPETAEASDFSDEESISYWAVDAVHTAQRAGIINGRDGNMFDPHSTATRAEVAAILHRFAEKMN